MSAVLEIDVGEMDPRFALMGGTFGKCIADFFMRCPDDLKADFSLKAAKLGQSAAWRAQFWMAVDVYGVDHVVSLIAKSCPVAGAAAQAYARAMVDDMLASLGPQRAVEPANDRIAG